MLVTSVALKDVVELPGPDTEWKFQHWSGEEIYPEEVEEYRLKAEQTECYFLKTDQNQSEEDHKVVYDQNHLFTLRR